MAGAPRPWIVTPHGPIEKLEDNLWALQGTVPRMPFPRRMSMVRLADRRIVFLDAVPMGEEALAGIRAWGTPSILVVTNGYHRIDVHAFREKFGLTVLAPQRSAARVRERVQVDGPLEALPADPALRAEPLEGVDTGEAVFHVQSRGKTTLIFSDGVMNMHQRLRLLPRLFGFQGGPKVTPVFKMFVVKNKAALRAHYEKLAQTPGLARLVFCHGEAIEVDPAGALRKAAATI
jgi:hypothetical protein